MDWKELHAQPEGVAFCVVEIDPQPVYIKGKSLEDDIMVRPLFDPDDEGERRMGFREMDQCDLNSVDYHVLKPEDISSIMGKLNRRRRRSEVTA